MISIVRLIVGLFISIFLFLLQKSAIEQELNHPNILIILADDLGYGDLGVYNSHSLIPTPNLDRLASEGIRLTDAYCPVAVCSPTRYSLMTGRYSFRSWKNSVMANYEPSLIEDELLTLPEMLQEAGYSTAGFGKWHLGTTFPTLDGEKPVSYGKHRDENNGANLDLNKLVRGGPIDHGFDHWLGFSCASECWILEDKQVIGYLKHDFYTVEAASGYERLRSFALEEYLPYLTEQTIDFFENNSSAENPFFVYYSPYVPHIPLAVNEPFIGKTKAGLYGDYVHELDYSIGLVLDALDTLGLSENTVVLFASDNGSHFAYASSEIAMETAVNAPFSVDTAALTGPLHYPNAPLRGTKRDVWEGGVRTPLLARWPGHFPKGETNSELFALNDVLATLAALVDYQLPNHSAQDSYNLLPVLEDKRENIRESVVVQSSNKTYGLRHGKWKFIQEVEGQKPQLYDLSQDESETTNVYASYPEVAKTLEQKLYELLDSERTAPSH
ncbi:MAG: arylsulfatase [Bacteroidota bacterium]